MIKAIVILSILLLLMVVVAYVLLKSNITLKAKNKDLQERYERMRNFQEKAYEEIANLHDGDVVDNALAGLSKH